MHVPFVAYLRHCTGHSSCSAGRLAVTCSVTPCALGVTFRFSAVDYILEIDVVLVRTGVMVVMDRGTQLREETFDEVCNAFIFVPVSARSGVRVNETHEVPISRFSGLLPKKADVIHSPHNCFTGGIFTEQISSRLFCRTRLTAALPCGSEWRRC